MAIEEPASTLLDLPDPCLAAVLRCCNSDQRCLFNAAKAHSRLRQAAVLALCSIKAVKATQQQADSMLQYLENHGQHLDSISISGDDYCTVALPLPGNLHLHSVQFDSVGLQLRPGHGLLGVLGPAAGVAALTQLRLSDCKLGDSMPAVALAAAMWQLPQGLQHLCIGSSSSSTTRFDFPADVCRQLQQLTHLELTGVDVVNADADADPAGPVLQDLQALTRLVDLRLHDMEAVDITAAMLSGIRQLTRFEMSLCGSLEISALEGRTQLQHLALRVMLSDVQVAQLLSHLQHMQQLTHLDLFDSFYTGEDANPPGAPYSALTASSKLAHLNLSACELPAGVWQHVFPVGRQLPHLHYLNIECTLTFAGQYGIPPTCSTLVSCCPNLQLLNISYQQYSAELVATLHRLTELTGLSSLSLGDDDYTGEGMEVVCQLTGLQELALRFPSSTLEGLLLQLTQLKQLTALTYEGHFDGACKDTHFTDQVSHPSLLLLCPPVSMFAVSELLRTRPVVSLPACLRVLLVHVAHTPEGTPELPCLT